MYITFFQEFFYLKTSCIILFLMAYFVVLRNRNKAPAYKISPFYYALRFINI